MEFVLLSAILVGAIATVDIPEHQARQDDEEDTDTSLTDRPYGVHG